MDWVNPGPTDSCLRFLNRILDLTLEILGGLWWGMPFILLILETHTNVFMEML